MYPDLEGLLIVLAILGFIGLPLGYGISYMTSARYKAAMWWFIVTGVSTILLSGMTMGVLSWPTPIRVLIVSSVSLVAGLGTMILAQSLIKETTGQAALPPPNANDRKAVTDVYINVEGGVMPIATPPDGLPVLQLNDANDLRVAGANPDFMLRVFRLTYGPDGPPKTRIHLAMRANKYDVINYTGQPLSNISFLAQAAFYKDIPTHPTPTTKGGKIGPLLGHVNARIDTGMIDTGKGSAFTFYLQSYSTGAWAQLILPAKGTATGIGGKQFDITISSNSVEGPLNYPIEPFDPPPQSGARQPPQGSTRKKTSKANPPTPVGKSQPALIPGNQADIQVETVDLAEPLANALDGRLGTDRLV